MVISVWIEVSHPKFKDSKFLSKKIMKFKRVTQKAKCTILWKKTILKLYPKNMHLRKIWWGVWIHQLVFYVITSVKYFGRERVKQKSDYLHCLFCFLSVPSKLYETHGITLIFDLLTISDPRYNTHFCWNNFFLCIFGFGCLGLI